MYVMVLGVRALPGVQGGVETHVCNLYPLLVERGCNVEVLVRSAFQQNRQIKCWNGMRLKQLWSPRSSGLEAFVHSFIGTIYASIKRPDLLHIHAVGPMIMTPLARLFGLRVIVTHHGPDYEREKWGKGARMVLRLGEWCGMRFSHQKIVISDVIRRLVKEKYSQDSELIPNGITVHLPPIGKEYLCELGLLAGRYILQVSRIVPEKRQADLIKAFWLNNMPGWKLVLVGGIDNGSDYIDQIVEMSKEDGNIILTGYQSGERLQQLYANAGVFVLPSSHEGLPIAMLEAMSYGISVIASNIPANLEIGLPGEQYFELGDVEDLADKLVRLGEEGVNQCEREKTKQWVSERYNWNDIADATYSLYKRCVNRSVSRLSQ